MTDTIKKQLLKERHNFLGSYATITEKEGGKFKYTVDLQRNYNTKLKGVFYNNKQVGRTKGVHSKVEGIKYLKELEALARNVDSSVSTDAKRDYINAREALDNAGHTDLTVTDAIKKWLQFQPIISDLTVQQAWDEFITYKVEIEDIKPDTVKSLKNNAYNSLKPFLNDLLTDFEQPGQAGKLRAYIQKNWKDKTTRNHHFVKTSEFFNHFVNLDEPKISKNPIANRPKYVRDKERKPPKIATVEQVERILQIARDTDEELGMLAFWVITFFLGCRPKSEMSLMTWDDVHLEDRDDSFLMVSDESKTGRRRVEIYPFVYDWLMICNRKKPIFPADSRYAKDRRAILYSAGVIKEEWTTKEKKKWADFQRHTCASSMWRSEDFTLETIVNQLGHGIETSKKYYLDTELSKANAKRFFQIRPSTIGEKIVKIA
jgi:integrase